MTTREYQEAYDDDSDRVRSWPVQDAQEPHINSNATYLRGLLAEKDAEIDLSRSLGGKAADMLERLIAQRNEVQAERDAAWETIASMTLDHPPEHAGRPGNCPVCAR